MAPRGGSVLDGLALIDCDAHFTEPPDLWTSRAPQSLRDRVPVHRTIDGRTYWYLDGEPWAGTGGNVIGLGRNKVLGVMHLDPFDAIDPAAWTIEHRLDVMDDAGVWAQVLYPNAVGFASNHILAIDDLGLRETVHRIYNDFLVELQTASEGRLIPQMLLPIWDMDLTVREMTRLLELGARGFTLTDKPELLGLPELPDAYFDPMWDLFNASGAVANFHIGAGKTRLMEEAQREKAYGVGHVTGEPDPPRHVEGERETSVPQAVDPAWDSLPNQRALTARIVQSMMSNYRIITNLCLSDLFDRFDQLKIASAESGLGWVPFMLETLEFQYDQLIAESTASGWAKHRPLEYFRQHIYVMFWFEHSAPAKLIEDVGVNNVLIESDFPHPACYYPGLREHVADVLGDLDPRVVRRVVQDNAAELYGVTLPTWAA